MNNHVIHQSWLREHVISVAIQCPVLRRTLQLGTEAVWLQS